MGEGSFADATPFPALAPPLYEIERGWEVRLVIEG
jgi:hypothetical protein